jgi:hemerythrin-like domain-containing protein
MAAEKPTDLLRDEHAGVLQKLTSLERIVTHPDTVDATVSELKALTGFFQTEFWVHFDKEEQALFPEMGKYGPPDRGPVGAMLREHEELRNSNERFQSAVASWLAGPDHAQNIGLIKELGTHFIWMLRDHINKEDNMLFIMAEEWLDASQKIRVGNLFREIGDRGPGPAG